MAWDGLYRDRDEAEAVCRERNRGALSEERFPLVVTGPRGGPWRLEHQGGFFARELHQAPVDYEQTYLALIRASTASRSSWRELEGIEFEDVRLEGAYPETELIMVFKAVPSRRIGFGRPRDDCRFGMRWPVWPAGSAFPEEEAQLHEAHVMEFLGTDPEAYLPLRGGAPCDPSTINWLN